MDKKSLLAIVLIALLWGVYFIITKPEHPKTRHEGKGTVTEQRTEKAEKAAESALRLEVPVSGGTEQTIPIETKKYSILLSNRGASIVGCTYRERNIDLIVKRNPYGERGFLDFAIHFGDDEFLGGGPLEEALWTVRREGDRRVVFSTDARIDANPVKIEKAYDFSDETYGFVVEYRILNRGGAPLSFKNKMAFFSPAALVGPALDYTNTYNRLMAVYDVDGKFKKAEKGNGSLFSCWGASNDVPLKKEAGSVRWAGVMSRYFLVLMVPEKFSGTYVIRDNRKNRGFRTGMSVDLGECGPGKEIRKTFRVYLGEKDKTKLALVDKSIIDAADVSSITEPIRNFVIWCLMGINRFIGNLGWSIVIFSILTKIAFIPLTIKSTESMKKMQKLNPKLNELKVKYKDKPELLQQETWKLFRENKVNPMGGCFPLLLQFPFFIALYSALIDSIDLWRAPFILWMKDMSMPDTVATISGFHLNILPVVMTATTFLAQKLSTVDAGGQQRVMMMIMPLMFIFIFWSMPSGLVLYWSLQNIFQIAHQLVINYRTKEEKKG